MSKLTKQDLREIKQLLKRKNRNIRQIAKFYGVSRHSIYFLGYRRGWIKQEVKKEGLWEKTRNWLIRYLYGIDFHSQNTYNQRKDVKQY